MNNLTEVDLRIQKNLKERNRAEGRFRLFGRVAVYAALMVLVCLFGVIIYKGSDAFRQTRIAIDIEKPTLGEGDTSTANYNALIKSSLARSFPEVSTRRDKRDLNHLLSSGAVFELKDRLLRKQDGEDTTFTIWVIASDDVDMVIKGEVPRDAPISYRRMNDKQMSWLKVLEDAGRVKTEFNFPFFTSGDSREPEQAGIAGAAVGSLLSVLVCLMLAFPLGVMSALYLEEFAPKNFWTELIEVNINNLAAVPSIVFGLLGLAVFLSVFNMPRSSPLVGGMVLALMTLPTIVIAGRAAIKAVPPSIREAAFAVGANPVQVVFHHVLPLALPGIMTGTIIGTARALGETAPLLMIGMVAFVVDVPTSIFDPATALPVQVFLWADIPERAFGERTALAIMVLLAVTCLMNLLAVVLRKKFEIRW